MSTSTREANIRSLIATRSPDYFEVTVTDSFVRIYNENRNILRFADPNETDENLADFAITMTGI